MEDEAILTTTPVVTPVGTEENTGEESTDTSRKMIPIPTDKFRELNRELAGYRAKARESTLSTASKVPLNPEQETALDLIADRTTSRISSDLNVMRDEMENMAFEQAASKLESDPHASVYQEEYIESLRELTRTNPNTPMRKLTDEARKDAIYKAYESGKLTQQLVDEADETTRVKTRLSSPSQSAASTGRGKQEKTLDDMTPQELVESGKFEEYFTQTQGRKPRR